WERREAPEGLLIALKALLADGGSPRRWLARGTRPRDALARSSKGELPVEALPAPKLSRELTEAVAAWRAARETLRAALRRAGADDEALARLGVVPSAAMVGEVKGAATAVVQSAARALGLARAPEALTWLLAHDAALIEDPLSDEALLAPGPLHPLCLAGALARADEAQIADEATSEEPWARWGLSQPLPRPARWPAPGGGALLASAPFGLAPVYETRPAPASEIALRSITARVTRRLVELHPHVLLGLGVLVEHDRPGAVVDGLVDGLTAALGALPGGLPATRLTVYTATAPALGSAASRWVVEGRLILAPSPLDAASRERLPAQLHLRVPPPPAPAQVAISAPLTAPPGRPTYTTIDGGWAERLPHTCVPEGEALADAVQRALRGPSEGAFTTTRAAARAEPTRTRALWRAELAELLPPPTPGATLLIDERSEGHQARVYCADLRALAERLTEVLGTLDPQAKTEEARLERLRAQCVGGAALTLDGALSRALGARQQERALRDELGAGALIVSVGPELLGALLLPPLVTPLLLGLALKDTLAVRVVRVEALEAEGARRDGTVAEARVLALVRAAARAEGSADVQARALLAAMVWPALQPSAHGGLALWLNGGRGVEVA
ncbi:hypothetical protein L6R46_20210, partial [Myxococcota bacterium]|nr:hypothetical protein [Myxococcota bacterium]